MMKKTAAVAELRSPWFGVVLVLLSAVVWSACERSSPAAPSISAAELAKRLGGAGAPVVLDVRSPAEYAAGHIPGALNIPHDQLAARLAELPADESTEIVVHCQSGRRAATAEGVLKENGYSDVRDLEGHMGGWLQQGYPVEAAKAP